MESLQVPRPAWMTEDLVLLEEQARRFLASRARAACREVDRGRHHGALGLGQARAGGPAAAPACRRNTAAPAARFAHETVINREIALAGLDSIGAPLHSGIVAPYILNYGTEEQKKKWLPKLATGELIGAIAMSEPGTGSDLQGVRTTREEIRQRLRAQRLEDLHHQRPARQPDHRRRQDRSERRAPRASR